MWCDHCSHHGHTKDICWKIHGKPANWVPQRQTEGRGFQAQSNQDKQGIDPSTQHQSTNSSIPLRKEQLEQFYHLLNPSPAPSLSNPDLGSCSIAQFGNHSALTSLVHSKELWIIDSGASDHMIGGSNFFLSYTSCPSSTKIKIANGSLSSIAGIGSIGVPKDLILHSVLHVLALKCNLLSISKITRDNNCVTNFHSSMCQFLSLGRTSARIHEGLYYLENTEYEGRQAFASRVASVSVSNAREIMLWHHF